MTTEELLKLIDACRSRGVAHLKTDGVEFSLAPMAPELQPFEPEKPVDHTKCLKCQQREPNGRIAGYCRLCSLDAAGVAS